MHLGWYYLGIFLKDFLRVRVRNLILRRKSTKNNFRLLMIWIKRKLLGYSMMRHVDNMFL